MRKISEIRKFQAACLDTLYGRIHYPKTYGIKNLRSELNGELKFECEWIGSASISKLNKLNILAVISPHSKDLVSVHLYPYGKYS